jgi:MYXO-CTERM domain-containing protein
MSDGANDFLYDTTANGNDYADFLANCPAGPLSIQDAQGCPGNEAGRRILNDGGAELNILNAVGYEVPSAPEPGAVALPGGGLALLGLIRRRRA